MDYSALATVLFALARDSIPPRPLKHDARAAGGLPRRPRGAVARVMAGGARRLHGSARGARVARSARRPGHSPRGGSILPTWSSTRASARIALFLERGDRDAARRASPCGWRGTAGRFAARTRWPAAGCSAPGGCSRTRPRRAERAWLEVREGALALFEDGDPDRAHRHATEGIRIAQAVRSTDLEMLGRAVQGLALVESGRGRRRACARSTKSTRPWSPAR